MGGGSDTTQNTQSQSVTQLPPWINQAAQQNYGFAQNVAMQPLQQYQGQMVADVSPQMQQSWDTAATGGNAGQDQYNAAQAGYLTAAGTPATQVTPQSLATTNLQPYMNPYTQDVINATLPLMQQQNALQQNQIANQANSANAFGGSRQGIQQGVAQAQGAMNIGQMAAQLNQANFGQAQAAATGDISRNLAAQQGNQQADQANINSLIAASGGLGALGNQAQASQVRNFTEQLTAGQMEQQQAQNQINAQMAKFQNAANYPNQQLSVLQSALGMTPYEQGQQSASTTQTQTAANPLGQVIGGAQALGSLLPMFMPASDRRLKTDITKVGTHPSGIAIHAYRYKGDPKTYPKVVGPMAEDVAKKFGPGAVAKIPGSGGKMAVHPAIMGALAAPRGYADGTADVQPGPTVTYPTGQSQQLMVGPPQYTPLTAEQRQASPDHMGPMYSRTSGRAVLNDPRAAPLADPRTFPAWKQYARGVSQVPGALSSGDTVPAMLSPGEAVLNRHAAAHLGRHNIAALNALAAPRGPAMAPPILAASIGGPRMPGPNLAAIAGARPPMGAMAPPIPAAAMGGPRMPGPNLAAIASGGMGPLAGPKPMRARRLRMPQLRGALAGG